MIYTDIPENYNMSLAYTISSDDVGLIKEIAEDITGLINQGIDISVYDQSYSYSKLPELKVEFPHQTETSRECPDKGRHWLPYFLRLHNQYPGSNRICKHRY